MKIYKSPMDQDKAMYEVYDKVSDKQPSGVYDNEKAAHDHIRNGNGAGEIRVIKRPAHVNLYGARYGITDVTLYGEPHKVVRNKGYNEEFDEDGIEEDYLKDLAKVRAKHRGGDINLAEKELRDLYGDVIIPKQSRTLGDVMEEQTAAKKQAKYNEKNFKR